MTQSLDNESRSVLVTGGSRGIGKAIARVLAREGFQVVLTYVSKPEEAANVVNEIKSNGGVASAFALDVGDPAAIEDFFASEIKDRINLFALVNNAGITRDGLLLRMKDEAFDTVIDINLRGAFVCSREAAKIMSKKRIGRMVNITSVVGQTGNAGQINYSASKAGLIGLTKACAKELASRNITVNAVAPGFIATEMTAVLDEKVKQGILNSIPLGRYGTVEDVAETVAFLVSDRASYITGQIIGVNGGLY